MIHRFYYEGSPIAKDDGATLTWFASPLEVQAVAHTHGPNDCFSDQEGFPWTGDDFWRYAGDLRWAR